MIRKQAGDTSFLRTPEDLDVTIEDHPIDFRFQDLRSADRRISNPLNM